MYLKELFLKEDDRSTAVFAFGRFNPPTIGHQKLIEKVQSMAGQVNGKAYIFLSHKQNNKTDPLSFKDKQSYIQRYYPDVIVGDPTANTIIKALQVIQAQGRTRIVMVAGSDRVVEFQKLLNQYNGKPDKAGNELYKFDYIDVVNAGQRDPDEEGMVLVNIEKVRSRRMRSRKTLVEVTASDATGSLKLVFFNQPWREKQLNQGRDAVVFGKTDIFSLS